MSVVLDDRAFREGAYVRVESNVATSKLVPVCPAAASLTSSHDVILHAILHGYT